MKVLATKAPDKEAIDYAAGLGFELSGRDFIAVTGLDFDFGKIDIAVYDSVAFTSVNAVTHFFEKIPAGKIKGKKVYALQGKTNDALGQLGISPTLTAGNAASLADKIMATGTAKSALHICGNKALADLGTALKAAGIAYHQLVVYTTELTPTKVEQKYDALFFYSPSGLESFLLKNTIPTGAVCCCIGVTTAMALAKIANSATIITAKQPDTKSMLDALTVYYKLQKENERA